VTEEVDILKRRLDRERAARKQAEDILETKALELYEANVQLKTLNTNLEKEVDKRSEALRESEIKYRGVLENMELGVVEVDFDARITKSYDKFNQLVGYKESELIGKILWEIFLEEQYHKSVKSRFIEFRENGGSMIFEAKLIKKDGGFLDTVINASPFYDAKAEAAGYVGVIYDITQRNRLQEELKKARDIAEQAQQAEKQFLANMSHEIRTPLNAVIGMTHLMDDTPLNEEQTSYLNILKNASSILKNLITDVLDISKIDSGNLEVVYSSFNLEQLVQDLVRTFTVKTDKKNLKLYAEIDPKIQHFISSDRKVLNQVLVNLIGNAIKFTDFEI